jgi:hypothetical protein
LMDRLPNLNAHRVTHPIALLAFGVGAMLVLLFFGAPWYVVMGVILVILITGFAVLIKFPQLRMEGEHLYNYESGAFDNFEAEATQSGPPEDSTQQDVDEDIDTLRVQEYKQNRGLFLVHAERVSANGTGYVGSGNGKDVYLFYAPETITTFGEDDLMALPEGDGRRVVYADRCAVDEEELGLCKVEFRKIPRDLQDLITRFDKDGRR